MEHQPSEVCDLMPCKLDWSQLKFNGWAFWSMKHNDELEYKRSINSIFSYSVVSMFPTEKWRIRSVMDKMWNPYISLVQFWAPIKVNGSTFLSTEDQPFAFYQKLDKRLSSYRKVCLDTSIPMEGGPPARVFSRRLPEYNPDVSSYSYAEFPLVQTAIHLGIHSYYAFPVSNLHHQCVGVFEIVSTQPTLYHPNLIKRMLFEVVKVSPSDEFDSFEIGKPLLSVQSLQDGGETTEMYYFCQQSNLQKENNVAAELLVPSCSSDKRDSLNFEGTVEVDPSLPHPIEEAVTNRGTVNVDVAHDDHIEDTSEMMQLDSHFEQPNLEINSVGARSNDTVEHRDFSYARQSVEAEAINRENNFVSGAMINNEKIHSQKNNEFRRIEKDHGITRETLEQQYGMILKDAAKNLGVSRATLKRICRVYEITRWPHHKTRKVNVHVSQGVSFQGAEPYVVDQQCPALSQEKGTEYLGNKRSPATGVSRDGVMTLKVTYRGDIIKFQLSLSSTRVELEGEVEKRFKIALERFSIKYQDEDDDWILITSDSDLRDGMNSLRLLGRNTMRLVVTPEADT